ncbi:MAG: NAD(P)-dependent oxidoreductase [Alphaproteobacteria bacterium]|nr:NAD(P)-dependent oxidoreductase [Alphaproteobacteria bacterium]
MARGVFLAGAAGAVGRRLVPQLLGAGFQVTGSTRQPAKAEWLRGAGAAPVLVDVFDQAALHRAVAAARPEVVIHQLTDLPPALDPARMADAVAGNARLREAGTANLVAAALAAGARRFIAQSILWAYASGPEPHAEDDPLDRGAEGRRGVTVKGVVALEQAVLSAQPMQGIVLRYGAFWGPGTGFEAPSGTYPLHVDAAAQAALLAIDRGRPGLYNVVEDGGYASAAKAARELGWSPGFRLGEA